MSVDSAVLALLGADASTVTQSRLGTGFSSTFRVTSKAADGNEISYFLKTGSGAEAEVMFAGEHASLAAISNAVPGLAPRSLGHGKLSTSNHSFLLTEWLNTSARGSSRGSLAPRLASLHTTPAPIPEGFDKPQFGFPVKTCCGSTPQRNDYTASWSDFYAKHRLGFILEQASVSQRVDQALRLNVERTCREVVPRLLGDDHLNNGNGVIPVVVHGDLWSGNSSTGLLPGMSEPQEIIYDSSACYAHSEYELGIMRMFGGFSQSFFTEYHRICPKTEPVGEYEDRIALYELYHHLNHFAMFGGSYRSGAMSIMDRLLSRYGNKPKA